MYNRPRLLKACKLSFFRLIEPVCAAVAHEHGAWVGGISPVVARHASAMRRQMTLERTQSLKVCSMVSAWPAPQGQVSLQSVAASASARLLGPKRMPEKATLNATSLM